MEKNKNNTRTTRGGVKDAGKRVSATKKVFTEEQLRQLKVLAGALNIDHLCDFFNIGKRTFYDIKKRDVKFREAYRQGRAATMASVSRSLIKRALSGDINAIGLYIKYRKGFSNLDEVDDEEDADQDNKPKYIGLIINANENKVPEKFNNP